MEQSEAWAEWLVKCSPPWWLFALMSVHSLPALHKKYSWLRSSSSVISHAIATVAASRSGSALASLLAVSDRAAWLAKDAVVPLQLLVLWFFAFPNVATALQHRHVRAVTGCFAALYSAHTTLGWAATGMSLSSGGSLIFPVILATANGCASQWIVDAVLYVLYREHNPLVQCPHLLGTNVPSRKFVLVAVSSFGFAALSPHIGELLCSVVVVLLFQMDHLSTVFTASSNSPEIRKSLMMTSS